MKGFVIFKYSKHFVAFKIKNENYKEKKLKVLNYDELNYGYIDEIDIESIDKLFLEGYLQTLINVKIN